MRWSPVLPGVRAPEQLRHIEDAIVRAKANEVRKRLAQYCQDSGGTGHLRIELPAGSYVPMLTWMEGTNGSAPSEPALSRVVEPSSQRVTVAAAGMSRFGAQVAGEFLTTPRGWGRSSCQIVIETKVIGTTPGSPKIAAVHFW